MNLLQLRQKIQEQIAELFDGDCRLCETGVLLEEETDVICEECYYPQGYCDKCNKKVLTNHEGYCRDRFGHNHLDCKNPVAHKGDKT